MKHRVRIGLVSDTHGLLRAEAIEALRGSDFIVHAGDIGDASIVEALRALAPLTMVRGNNDLGAWARGIPELATLQVGGIAIGVVHELRDAGPLVDQRVDAIVHGHSHQPAIAERDGVLYVNPGSAGPRRFSLPVSVGEIVVEGNAMHPRLITLHVPPPRTRR